MSLQVCVCMCVHVVCLDTNPEKGFPILVVVIETPLLHWRKCGLYKEKSTIQHKTSYTRSYHARGSK